MEKEAKVDTHLASYPSNSHSVKFCLNAFLAYNVDFLREVQMMLKMIGHTIRRRNDLILIE